MSKMVEISKVQRGQTYLLEIIIIFFQLEVNGKMQLKLDICLGILSGACFGK